MSATLEEVDRSAALPASAQRDASSASSGVKSTLPSPIPPASHFPSAPSPALPHSPHALPLESDRRSYASTPDPNERVIVPGGESERRVWNTLELRFRIFKLLDRPTLASLLQLEKAVSASVAAILYRDIHVSLMSKMSRAKGRRTTYCDAVITLDRSPHPDIISPLKVWEKVRPAGQRFDPLALLKIVKTCRKKFPNLQRIFYQYPKSDMDDAYVVHLDGDKITVDLESHVQFDTIISDRSHQWPPTLPPTPVYSGMDIRHSIAIKIIMDDLETWDIQHRYKDYARLRRNSQAWIDWLYRSPNLDRRVTSLDALSARGAEDTLEGVLEFLAQRKRDHCEPMSSIHLPPSSTPLTPERFAEVVAVLAANPEIRTLRVEQNIVAGLDCLQTAIAAFDAALPSLHRLVLTTYGEPESTPLSGLPNLRIFSMSLRLQESTQADAVKYLCRLGSERCAYQDPEQGNLAAQRAFSETVRELRPLVLAGDDLRYHNWGEETTSEEDEEDEEDE